MAVNTTRFPLRGTQPRSSSTERARVPHAARPRDDEILGLAAAVQKPGVGDAPTLAQSAVGDASADGSTAAPAKMPAQTEDQNGDAQAAISPELEQILEANPQLRDAWETAQQFRAVFATPAAAQDAKTQLDELDSMFFSGQPGDQAALASRIHDLSPAAFHGLAQAMQAHSAKIAADAAQGTASGGNEASTVNDGESSVTRAVDSQTGDPAAANPRSSEAARAATAQNGVPVTPPSASVSQGSSPTDRTASAQQAAASSSFLQSADPRRAAQLAFFHSTNSAAVQQVVSAIEAQVNHLLPTGISAPTKTRIVGEIYRDLSSALGANRQLGQQLRAAFRSGAGDAAHQHAIIALVAGRAKQALPSIARRVINEWTHSVVSANQDKLLRQDSAAKRVDISGAGSSDGVRRKPRSPRDLDYKRLSDADILNL